MQGIVLSLLVLLVIALAGCSTAESVPATIAGSTAIAATQTPVPTETTLPTETPTEAATASAEPTAEQTLVTPTETPEPAATSTEVAAASPIDALAETANITVVNAPGAPENENPVPIWFGDQVVPWGIEITDMEEFTRLIFSEWIDNLIVPVLTQSAWTHEEFQPYRDLYNGLEDKSEAAVQAAIVEMIQREGFVRLPWLEWDGWYPGVTELPRYSPPVRATVVRANLDFTVEVLNVNWDSNDSHTFSPEDVGLEAFPQNLIWFSAGSAIMFDGTNYHILLKDHAAAAATAAKPNFVWAFDYLPWATLRSILWNDDQALNGSSRAQHDTEWSWDEQGKPWPLETERLNE